MNKDQILAQLRQELGRVDTELQEKEAGLSGLRSDRLRLQGAIASMEGNPVVASRRGGVGGHRIMSEEARERIREAQRARWEKFRKEQRTPGGGVVSSDIADAVKQKASKALAQAGKGKKN